MADVTVSELAKSVGIPVERLLQQMQEAGSSQKTADATVSDEERQRLLSYLKTSQGKASSGTKKDALTRKTTTTLKTGSGSGRKTVNVEVRKKRTYAKRDELEQEEEVVEQPPVAPAEPVAAVPEEPVEPAEAEPEAAPAPAPEVEAEKEPEPEPEDRPSRTSFVDDAEEIRLAAQRRRRAEEERLQAELKEIG